MYLDDEISKRKVTQNKAKHLDRTITKISNYTAQRRKRCIQARYMLLRAY